jgi:hypothetical protein
MAGGQDLARRRGAEFPGLIFKCKNFLLLFYKKEALSLFFFEKKNQKTFPR